MRFPRAVFRTLVSPVLLATFTLSTPTARAQTLVLTPANLHFGKVAIGQRNIRTVTLSNWGNATIRLNQAVTRGTGFTLSGLDLPLTLATGESFTFSAMFAPRSPGGARGSISFVSDASSNAGPVPILELAGTGTDAGQLDVTPATLDFGTVLVGSLVTRAGQLIASGEPVTIYSADFSSSEFTLSGLLFPLTIQPGQSQGYTVTFAPQASGAVSATLSFMSDGQSAITVQNLIGTAVISDDHSVDLSWNASTSQDVIGYNVYRGDTSGGPYQKINSKLDASTAYTDGSVSNGNTYYYVTTAVDSSNQESVYSNEAQARIPRRITGVPGSMRSPAFGRRIARTYRPSRNRH